jgi:hypothetical protein
LYWSIGNYIITEMQYETYSQHGQQILATLSQRLTEMFGKGLSKNSISPLPLFNKMQKNTNQQINK